MKKIGPGVSEKKSFKGVYEQTEGQWKTEASDHNSSSCAFGSGELKNKIYFIFPNLISTIICLIVCVEVLQPSQPNGVMSSAVSLPNHTFTGQALSSKRLTSIVHIVSPKLTTALLESAEGRE